MQMYIFQENFLCWQSEKLTLTYQGGLHWAGRGRGKVSNEGGRSVCTTLGRELVCLTGSGCESMAIFFNRPHSSTSSFLLWIKLSHFLLWSWLINDKRHRITTFTNDKKFIIATLQIQKTESLIFFPFPCPWLRICAHCGKFQTDFLVRIKRAIY